MITITDNNISGTLPDPFSYAQGRPFLGRLALRITRLFRTRNALRYMKSGRRHLDIGCGDGHLLLRSSYDERVGLDRLVGDDVSDRLEFADGSVDCVTMLAVIEHLDNPRALLVEIRRVLRPGGILVLTTPKQAAEWLINLYVSNIYDEHEQYFDRESMAELADGLFVVSAYHTFFAGLNQVFCLTKPEN